MPAEFHSTARDPDLLTAEVGLLLDSLCGLPERILTSRPHGHLPPGWKTYDEALARYFPIDEKIRRGETLVSSELQLLLDLRDYLNGWAEPATGASITFTTFVVRKSPEARKGKADTERAYPEWIRRGPVLMGLLGSMTYVLRRYLRRVGDRLLTTRDLREYIVRLVLGTVFGVAIGL